MTLTVSVPLTLTPGDTATRTVASRSSVLPLMSIGSVIAVSIWVMIDSSPLTVTTRAHPSLSLFDSRAQVRRSAAAREGNVRFKQERERRHRDPDASPLGIELDVPGPGCRSNRPPGGPPSRSTFQPAGVDWNVGHDFRHLVDARARVPRIVTVEGSICGGPSSRPSGTVARSTVTGSGRSASGIEAHRPGRSAAENRLSGCAGPGW